MFGFALNLEPVEHTAQQSYFGSTEDAKFFSFSINRHTTPPAKRFCGTNTIQDISDNKKPAAPFRHGGETPSPGADLYPKKAAYRLTARAFASRTSDAQWSPRKKISYRACSSVMPVSLTKRRTTISGLFGALFCSSAIGEAPCAVAIWRLFPSA
ncbi:hypothetical protein NKH36_28735 [Mesorhizobium sp. M1312]|uniref:hypothetical protein n=1 Tax=unclassified Mesorhizobium TaxID=325217 RepID=UPI00333A5999